MQLNQLFTDEDAVSPVIGVILMVAITVILAAVIASFVLGLGGTEDPAPSPTLDWSQEANFDFDDDWDGPELNDSGTSAVVIDVTGGDSFDSTDMGISVGGAGVADLDGADGSSADIEDDEGPWSAFSELGDNEDVSAGDTAVIPVEDGDDWEIDLIWDPADDDPEIVTSQDS